MKAYEIIPIRAAIEEYDRVILASLTAESAGEDAAELEAGIAEAEAGDLVPYVPFAEG